MKKENQMLKKKKKEKEKRNETKTATDTKTEKPEILSAKTEKPI